MLSITLVIASAAIFGCYTKNKRCNFLATSLVILILILVENFVRN